MKGKRRRLTLRVKITLATLGSIVFLGGSGYLLSKDRLSHYFELQKVLAKIEFENQSLKNEQGSILQEMTRLQDPSYLERLARENLGMIKANEIFIIIDK